MRPACAIIIAALLMATGSAIGAQDAQPYFVRNGMVSAINPPITAIWGIQAATMDDDGQFDPAQLSEADWAALREQARAFEAATQAMATAPAFAATDPAGLLGDAADETDLEAVDARLHASPATFRTLAEVLANHSAALTAAVEARDPAMLTRLVNDAQPVCKACHSVFWYPEQYAGG